MIEITGNHSKSIIFERLLNCDNNTLGIVFSKNVFKSSNKNVLCIEEPTEDSIYEFIHKKLDDFKFIIIYSNYWEREIRPFIEMFRRIEKENSSITFIVMYYKSNF